MHCKWQYLTCITEEARTLLAGDMEGLESLI